MTDLIKRLRVQKIADEMEPHEYEGADFEYGHTRCVLDGRIAADRIEELVKELQDTEDRANAFATKEYYTEMRAERAEAKLAKAVERSEQGWATAKAAVDRGMDLERKLAKAVEALRCLGAVADAFDANELDDEARKFWGRNYEHENHVPLDQIEIYCGRGGKGLLTLSDAMKARTVLAELEGGSEYHEKQSG